MKGFVGSTDSTQSNVENVDTHDNTNVPAYSDTANSDTPLTVTVLGSPKIFVNKVSL